VIGASPSTHQKLDLAGRRVKKMFWGEDDKHWVAGSQYDWGVGILFENGDVYIRGVTAGQVGMDGGGWTMSDNNTAFTNKFHSGVKDIWVQFGGYQCAVALMNDGTVQARGNQSYAQNGMAAATTVWTTIGGAFLQNVTKLSVMGGQYGSTNAALRSDGKLVVWGGNMQGCVGDGRAPGTGDNFPDSFYLSERPIVDFCWGGVRYEATGANQVYALNDLGQVLVAGAGDYNANGDDDSENALTPQLLRF